MVVYVTVIITFLNICIFVNKFTNIVMDITLSSNASMVLFEYPQYYLNKKEVACKARVNEWIVNQI